MPTSHGPVGPFPAGVDPDEYDRLRRRVLWTMPSGLYVVGSREGERRNGMTLNWATQVSFDPKLARRSASRRRPSPTSSSTAGGVFSALHHRPRGPRHRPQVHQAGRGRRGGADAQRLPVPRRPSPARRSSRRPSPIVECEVRQPVDVGGHTLFVGEVVDAGFAKAEETPVLRMEDTRMNYGG